MTALRVSQLAPRGTILDDDVLLVSVLSPTIFYTAATISASASENAYIDSAEGFTAFAVGDQIQVTGFTGDVANNIYSGTVTAKTDGMLTIGGADGDVITDDAAGESVTITKWISRRILASELAAYAASVGADASNITYTPSDNGNWDGSSDPGNVDDALDELAARVVAVEASTSTPVWDAHAFYPGLPTASAIIVRIPSARSVNFAANFAGSYGVASVAATASTVFSVTKNGSSIGSITFAAAASTATFTTSGGLAQTLSPGDVLAITAPGTPDATLANVGFVLAGTR